MTKLIVPVVQTGKLDLFNIEDIAGRLMARSLPVTVLTSILLGICCVDSWMLGAVQSAPRHSFPGRRIGGGTRGECAARRIVHLVPESSVFAPGSNALIGILEGPSPRPQTLEVIVRSSTRDGTADPDVEPVVHRQLPAAVNRLLLLSIPTVSRQLVWESSYRCDGNAGGDEFGFITASFPPALSLLVQQGGQSDQQLQQQLADLKTSCGATTRVAPLKTVLQLGDDIVDDAWPETVTVACF